MKKYQSKHKTNTGQLQDDPVLSGIKWILLLGRIFGFIPHSHIFSRTLSLQIRWCSLPLFYTFTLIIYLTALFSAKLWTFLQGIGTRVTILEQIMGFEGIVFVSSVWFIYVYHAKNTQKLITLLDHWKDATKRLNFATKDIQFPRFVFWITALVLSLGVTENILYDIYPSTNIVPFGRKRKSLLEQIFFREGEELTNFMPYNPILSIILVVTAKFSNYAWNLNDIFIIAFCRAISFKFIQLNQEIKQWIKSASHLQSHRMLSETSGLKKLECLSIISGKAGNPNRIENVKFQVIEMISENDQSKSWDVIRDKTFIVLNLTKSVTTFVTPLVFICYLSNIYLMILQSLQFLSGISSDESAYVYLSYLQFTMRTILVTYYTSNVYHSTEQIVETLDGCPDSKFSETATRLERMLARHPVGISIFGAFKIRRKFFISIISFLFTTEIVILQAMSASSTQT